MSFFANRAATRMGSRQQYRTMARMQRRRSYIQAGTGTHQDFQPRYDEPNTQTSDEANSDYGAELQELAQLKKQGLLTEEEYAAKKKQLLGI